MVCLNCSNPQLYLSLNRKKKIMVAVIPRGGEAPPQVQTPHSFICHFRQERYPFDIPSIEKMVPL